MNSEEDFGEMDDYSFPEGEEDFDMFDHSPEDDEFLDPPIELSQRGLAARDRVLALISERLEEKREEVEARFHGQALFSLLTFFEEGPASIAERVTASSSDENEVPSVADVFSYAQNTLLGLTVSTELSIDEEVLMEDRLETLELEFLALAVFEAELLSYAAANTPEEEKLVLQSELGEEDFPDESFNDMLLYSGVLNDGLLEIAAPMIEHVRSLSFSAFVEKSLDTAEEILDEHERNVEEMEQLQRSRVDEFRSYTWPRILSKYREVYKGEVPKGLDEENFSRLKKILLTSDLAPFDLELLEECIPMTDEVLEEITYMTMVGEPPTGEWSIDDVSVYPYIEKKAQGYIKRLAAADALLPATEVFVQELFQHLETSGIATIRAGEHVQAFDVNRQGDHVEVGYEPAHAEFFLYLIGRAFLESGSVVWRTFTPLFDVEEDLPIKEVRMYTLRPGAKWRQLSEEEAKRAAGTDPNTGLPLEPEKTVIYKGP